MTDVEVMGKGEEVKTPKNEILRKQNKKVTMIKWQVMAMKRCKPVLW